MNVATVSPENKLITGEELLAMGDIGPCELIDGKIVPMTPTGAEHGVLESNLTSELRNFVRQHELGWVMSGEVGVYIRRHPDRVRGADIAFISKDRLPTRPGKGFLETAPELIVEIISPRDLWQDMHEKIEDYFTAGVQWVWIVEPKNKVVRVYHSPTDVLKLNEKDTLCGEGILSDFALLVADIFPV